MLIEQLFIITAIVLYALSVLIALKVKSTFYARLILSGGILAQLTSIIIRWAAIGHPPIFGTYEAALHGSVVLAVFVLASYKSVHGHFRGMVLTAIPLTIILILYGFIFNTKRIPLTISELNIWVDFHAFFSWMAFAPFTLAFSLSAAFLWNNRKNAKKEHSSTVRFWPEPEIVDELAFRYINFGFLNHTIMFAMGSYYSSILYGSWWQWDPVESTSLITWLCVALYIHMRLFYNWKEKRAAWFMLFIFFTIIISYWGLIYFPEGSTFHIFDIDMKGEHG